MDKKISQLTALTTPDNADEFAIVDTSATITKKITYANLTLGLQTKFTSTEGITAFAGGGQGSATALTASYNYVDTVASTNDSVKAIAATANAFQYIQNNGASDLNVYPQSGELFKGLAANAPISISPGGQLTLNCATAGTWRYF